MKRVNKKVLFFSVLVCLGAGLLAAQFGQETPILFTKSSRLCPPLREIPYAEDLGIVKRVTKVEIPGIDAPYNPGLIKHEDGLLLAFRHDKKESKEFLGFKLPFRKKIQVGSLKFAFRTMISAVKMDNQFNPTTEPARIDTGSNFSEDPRLFKIDGQSYITYNEIADNRTESRTIRIAKLDPETKQLSDKVNLELNLRRIEKNWVPFTYEENGISKLHFGYYFNPHVILRMDDPTKDELTHLIKPNHIAVQHLPWKKFWGIIRGGTPPILVDGQYLAFFHSFFKSKGKIWYVMGAYTFEAHPPFRITACSPRPICFKGMYNTRAKNTAHSRKPSVFPSGLVLSEEDGKEVLHVACGINDCAIKVVTFDKEALIRSLVEIPEHQKGSF